MHTRKVGSRFASRRCDATPLSRVVHFWLLRYAAGQAPNAGRSRVEQCAVDSDCIGCFALSQRCWLAGWPWRICSVHAGLRALPSKRSGLSDARAHLIKLIKLVDVTRTARGLGAGMRLLCLVSRHVLRLALGASGPCRPRSRLAHSRASSAASHRGASGRACGQGWRSGGRRERAGADRTRPQRATRHRQRGPRASGPRRCSASAWTAPGRVPVVSGRSPTMVRNGDARRGSPPQPNIVGWDRRR